MRRFREAMSPDGETRILDVGGTPFNWQLLGGDYGVTLLNLRAPEDVSELDSRFSFVEGDGTRLDYPDGAFEIVFSNSVIEHLFTHEKQQLFAAELRRVGRKLWVQTPARWFPLEPHFLTPLVHYLPLRWQRRLVRNFTVLGWFTRPSQAEVDQLLDSLRLLTYSEFQDLFPDCRIVKERFLFLTKSFVAVRE